MVSPVTNYDASTGHMCFPAALVSMKRDGSRVRRSAWAPGHWIGIEDLAVRGPRIYYRLPNGHRERWERPMADLLAEDWMEALIPYGTVNP
jgi:hypothetical protein